MGVTKTKERRKLPLVVGFAMKAKWREDILDYNTNTNNYYFYLG